MVKKTSIAFLALAALGILVTGCSSDESSVTASSSGDSTTSETGDSSSIDSSSGDSSTSSSTSSGTPIEGAQQPSVSDPQGERSSLNELRATSDTNGLPSLGQANILVVPVNFADDNESFLLSDTEADDLEDAYFGASGSVASYYSTSSYGNLSLDGVVSPIVTLPETVDTYGFKAYYYSIESVIAEITEYVYDYLFVETGTYDIEDFDADDDGKVDYISLCYSWPNTASVENETLQVLLSYLLVDGEVFHDSLGSSVLVNSASWSSARISSAEGSGDRLARYVYTSGLSLGLDDYSDSTVSDFSGISRAPLGHVDAMDGYGGDHNPFSKYQLGWVEPTVITPSNVGADGTTLTIGASVASDDVILLSYEDQGEFGEYLLIDLYSPTSLNEYSANNNNTEGRKNFSEAGIRVYKVDSRLAYLHNDWYYNLYDEPDFASGETYRYAYSNDSVNPLYDYGITSNYALVELLDASGSNRHMTDESIELTNDSLFHQGDTFGGESIIPGFYEDFKFDGDGFDGEYLGLAFTVDSLSSTSATITITEAE